MKTAPRQTEVYEKKVGSALKVLHDYVIKPTEGRKREFRDRIERAVKTPHGYYASPGDLTLLTSDDFLGKIADNDVPTWRMFLASIRQSSLYVDFLYLSPLSEAA